jgi:hypothetical protein
MNVTVLWDVAPCSLVEIERRFTGAYCFHQQGGQFLRDYTAQHPTRQSFSVYLRSKTDINCLDNPWPLFVTKSCRCFYGDVSGDDVWSSGLLRRVVFWLYTKILKKKLPPCSGPCTWYTYHLKPCIWTSGGNWTIQRLACHDNNTVTFRGQRLSDILTEACRVRLIK